MSDNALLERLAGYLFATPFLFIGTPFLCFILFCFSSEHAASCRRSIFVFVKVPCACTWDSCNEMKVS